jgi:GAF domain-containing protein/two-component sensor histidine kinase
MKEIEKTGNSICAKIDLGELDYNASFSDEQIFWKIEDLLFVQLLSLLKDDLVDSYKKVKDELTLQEFMHALLTGLGKNIVAFIDHCEKVRNTPVKSVFNNLALNYKERKAKGLNSLIVVSANSFSTVQLVLGPDAPYQFPFGIFVPQLSDEARRSLIKFISKELKIAITDEALQYCLEYASGDRYLISCLCEECADPFLKIEKEPDKSEIRLDISGIPRPKIIQLEHMKNTVSWFFKSEAELHPPLQETIRAIESEPLIMLNALKIMKKGQIKEKDLISCFDDRIVALQLTGAVKLKFDKHEKIYSIRNKIYEICLKKHFKPERVVDVLTRYGKWDEAIHYLENEVDHISEYRSTALGTVIHAIYAAESESEACDLLLRGIKLAFKTLKISKVGVYLIDETRTILKLKKDYGYQEEPPDNLPIEKLELPEIQSFLNKDYLVHPSKGKELILIAPLANDKGSAIGIVSIHGVKISQYDENFIRLQAFFERVGRALDNVIDRSRRLRQLGIFNDMLKKVTSSLDLQIVKIATIDKSVEAIGPAQEGFLFLYDTDKRELSFKESHQDGEKKTKPLDQLINYAKVIYDRRQPEIWPKNPLDSSSGLIRYNEITVKSIIGVPLEAWDQVIGVICLVNYSISDAFQESDKELLSAFTAQAAISIQNARLHEELYELGIMINRGDIKQEEIFDRTVESIVRVSDVKTAHMLLLRDTDKPRKCLSQKPVVSRAAGLLSEVVRNVQPRMNGLTFKVLTEKLPQAVSKPEDFPHIHELVLKEGIQACLCLPMMIRGSIIGVLYVYYDKFHNFSQSEINMLSLFANQSASAIENARLREKKEEQSERLRSLQQISAKIVSQRKPNEILKSIAKYTAQLMKANKSLFLLFNEEHISKKTGYKYPKNHLESLTINQLQQGISGWVMRKRKACKTYNAMKDKRNKGEAKENAKKFNTGSLIVAPLIVKDKFLGTLTAANQVGDPIFTHEDKNLARMFANQAAIAMHNAQLFEQVNKARNFAEVVAKVTVIEGREKTLKAIVEGIHDVLNCDAVTLYTYDQEKNKFDFPPQMIGVLRPEKVLELGKVTKNSVIHKILALKGLYDVENVKSDSLVNGPFTKREGIRSCIGIPLIVHDRKVGVLFVNYRKHYDFKESSDTLKNISLFARQAAIAIRNDQLFEELRKTKGLVGSREALAWLGIMSSNWAHDVANYANSLDVQLGLLEKDIHDFSDKKEFTKILSERIEKIEAIAKEIQNVPSTVTIYSGEYTEDVISVNKVIIAQMKKLDREGFFAGIKCLSTIKDDSRYMIQINKQLFSRVINNVIRNAINAMVDSPKKELSIGTHKVGKRVEIIVADTGPGINDEIRSHIESREPVERKQGKAGMGYGLMLANFIVDQYSGKLEIKSTNSQGTKISIRFQLV